VRDRVTGQLTVRITNGSINERVEGHAHFAAHVHLPPCGLIGSGGVPDRGASMGAANFLFRSLRSRYTRKTIERKGARRPAAALGAHTSVTARGHATLIASSLRRYAPRRQNRRATARQRPSMQQRALSHQRCG